MPSRLPSLKVVLILLLLPVALALGIWLGAHPQYLLDPVADVLVGPQERRTAIEGLDTVHDKYFREVDYGKLSDAALAGAVKSLDDRFSAYLSPEQYGQFEQALDNSFTGIGTAIVRVDDGLRLVTVYPNSPAKRAGLRTGDVVARANGRSLAGLSEEAGSALIKGPEGSFVTLTIRRGTRTFTRRIRRERIEVPVVTSKIANADGQRVAYVSLASFGPRNASTQVAAAIRRLKRRGAKGIVLDLRDNGGGLVTQAQLIASMFLPDGKIVTTRGRAVKEQSLLAVGQPIAGKLPTVVLVDRDTASASEIVAGALQDRKRAKLVGERTFGKGVFQEIMPLENGGALDITVGQYFLPSGRNLGGPGTKPGQGLKPDVRVTDNTKTADDEVLDRGLDVLAGEL